MEKVLITGINGFVGSGLKDYLEKYYEIWGLDLSNQNICENFIESDITDLYRVSKDIGSHTFDYIIHCAAIAHNDDNRFSFSDFERVNSNGTFNLLKAFENNPPKKFIFFSTVAIYGEHGYKVKVDESFPAKPITDYGLSKLKAETFCLSNLNINTIILRFPAIYSDYLIRDFSKRIFKKKFIAFKFGKGNQQHTFCHLNTVKEQVDFILKVENIDNRIFQMGDSFNYSSTDILNYFKKEIKVLIPVPKWFFKVTLKPFIYIFPDKRNSLNSVYWKLFENNLYSIDSLLNLGFQPATEKLA